MCGNTAVDLKSAGWNCGARLVHSFYFYEVPELLKFQGQCMTGRFPWLFQRLRCSVEARGKGIQKFPAVRFSYRLRRGAARRHLVAAFSLTELPRSVSRLSLFQLESEPTAPVLREITHSLLVTFIGPWDFEKKSVRRSAQHTRTYAHTVFFRQLRIS